MYTYEENGEEVKAMTNAELYNLVDNVSNLSQAYNVGCIDEWARSEKKARIGFVATLCGTLIGTLYTLIHLSNAKYHLGASAVYRKYSDLHEDIEDLEAEWYNLDPEIQKQKDRFVK